MFYNSGEVISDQFNHITLDSKSGKFWKKSAKTRSFGNFFLWEGGGSPIPKSICQNSYQKVNILMKTKNAPKDLKCKINHTFFFLETGVPKRGGGGGVRHLGKIPKKSRFFWGGVPKGVLRIPRRILSSKKYFNICILILEYIVMLIVRWGNIADPKRGSDRCWQGRDRDTATEDTFTNAYSVNVSILHW